MRSKKRVWCYGGDLKCKTLASLIDFPTSLISQYVHSMSALDNVVEIRIKRDLGQIVDSKMSIHYANMIGKGNICVMIDITGNTTIPDWSS